MTNFRTAAAVLAIMAATSARAEDYSQPDDQIFHYSVMDAMRNGVYRGELTVKDLAKVGDVGLGTFNNLDGELIGLDGVFYRVAPDGRVLEAEPDRKIPFGAFAFFKEDVRLKLKVSGNFEEVQKQLVAALPSRNQLYAVRITGTFDEIQAGGATKVAEDDRSPIADLMKTRPIYTGKQMKGTIVGFYSPPYVGGIDLSPFHLHFLSDDKSLGGHIVAMSLRDAELEVVLDQKKGLDIELPHAAQDFVRPWAATSGGQKGY